MGDYDYLPFITFGGFSTTNSNSRIASLGSQRSDWNAGFNRPFTNISFAPTADLAAGRPLAARGYDLRWRRWDITNDGYGAGRYHFAGTYTRANNAAAQNDRPRSGAVPPRHAHHRRPTPSPRPAARPASSRSARRATSARSRTGCSAGRLADQPRS